MSDVQLTQAQRPRVPVPAELLELREANRQYVATVRATLPALSPERLAAAGLEDDGGWGWIRDLAAAAIGGCDWGTPGTIETAFRELCAEFGGCDG